MFGHPDAPDMGPIPDTVIFARTPTRVWMHPRSGLALDFEGVDNGAPFGPSGFWGHLAHRFCKIRPHTPDAEDAETIALMTGKPVKVGA